MICPTCDRTVYTRDLVDNGCPGCGQVLAHTGCSYSFHRCVKRGCKPAEVCPAGNEKGGRVYRDRWGGHHHVEDEPLPLEVS